MVPLPTAQTVASFLGHDSHPDVLALAEGAVSAMTAAARSHTRGRGFTDDGQVADDLAAVIITAAARLTTNPQQLARESLGSQTAWYRPAEWTLAERITLDRYRVKAVG